MATFDVAINGSNQLLVADLANSCVFVFTLDGGYVGKIGTKGSDKCQLYCPSGVAVDKHGCIFVTENGNRRVSVFDKNGTLVHCFGSKGSAEGQFLITGCGRDGLGISCSPNGSIYICDYDNMRIQVYSKF